MASIVKRGDSYRVSVSNGYDISGKKIVATKTFKKPENMTSAKWEKEIQVPIGQDRGRGQAQDP